MQPRTLRLFEPLAPAGVPPRPQSGTEEGTRVLPVSSAERARRRRKGLVFASGTLLLYGMDVLILGEVNLEALLTRVCWFTQMLAYVWVGQKLDERWYPALTTLNSVLASAFFLVLSYFTGGAGSPYLNLVPTMPLLLALIHPQTSGPAIGSGITLTLGVPLLLWGTEDGAAHALGWACMVGSATFFAAYSSEQLRKAQTAESEARLERARRESLEKLAVAERHRTQTEKLATVGRLAANVMHEINNPLAFVRSNLDFLRTEVLAQQLPEETRRELQEVMDETSTGVERIRQIVSDLRGFSRMDQEEPSECTLADVVTDAARLAGVRLKHVAKLKVEIPEELPEVFATRRRLAQVLLNLLVNAGDALEEAKVQGGEVRVRGVAEGGKVTLLVEDNGPGFPPEVLPKVFDTFFTTKEPEKGTGLGLSISRELVESFGGTLRAENRAEGGARLCLELPVHAPTTNNPPLPSGEGRGEGI